MASNNYIYKMSNAGGMSTVTRYTDMLAGNTTWNPWEPAGAYESIATITVPSGGAASATFVGIPQTYAHLQVRVSLKTTATSGVASDSLYCYPLSSETTADLYSNHRLGGDGSSAYAAGAANSANIIANFVPLAGITSTFGVGIIDILDYTNTNKTRVFRSLAGFDANGSGNIVLQSYRGGGLVPITAITFSMNGNFAANSQLALYGIKG